MTVAEWLELWLKRRANDGKLQAASVVRYQSLIKLHINPHIGSKALRLLSTKDINHLLL